MLRKSTKQWIEKEKVLREKVTEVHTKTVDERVKEHRIRKTSVKSIQDLTFLLENLSEEQLEQIFSVENLKPFLQALLALKRDNIDQRRKRRIIGLWDVILSSGLTYEYANALVGSKIMQALTMREVTTLQAIYYATRFPET